ncbi:GFA family protein [Vannielia litorea]|uniref:GFA family protein n=1 Tax=Vannielia litorea TaxID=1217970 RepID=UPI001C949253|nr:GFA family protein [Vannielia litorea]MBY6155481.1 GFA family protein [Vannielia litorea]
MLPDRLTGRCYCGATQLSASGPLSVAYCHCTDCRRWTGAPVTAWVGVPEVTLTPAPEPFSISEGVSRTSCPRCGSPLAASFSYLPGTMWLPMGLLDQAADLAPTLHCYAGEALPWLHISDDLPREQGSGHEVL